MNKNIFRILCGCLLTCFVSCSKSFVEKKPINSPTDANFWNNEADATGALAGAYGLLRASLNEMGMAYYYYGDMNTDEFIVRPNGEDYPSLTGIQFNTFVAPSQTFRGLIKMRRWDNFYRAIDEENRCIKYIPNISLNNFTSTDKQGAKNSLIGEAYFLRAFTYFYIARVWGDVPLVIETAQDAAVVPPATRAPQATVLDQCIKDIQEAAKLLNWVPTYVANRPIKANKGACYALLAHIYAWKGDYDKVIPATDSVINNGGYTYVDKSSKTAYISMYKGNSTESIFEISQNTTTEGQYITAGYGDIINCIAARTLKPPYIPITSTGTSLFGLDVVTLGTLFPNGPDSVDYRRKNAFDFWGTTDPICIKYSNIVYTGANNTLPVSTNNIVIFRLADIKLLKAEALAATGKPGDARTIVNEIRTRAGIGPTAVADGDMFAGVIDERARELFMEGHRYYDLIRLGKKTGVLKFNGSSTTVLRMDGAGFAAGKYYWPVEPILISLNPLLTQTPYWADKM
ncbi:MAG: RagB/SusD family nutrient uptake outer membrane protein [Bacteroidetes bacterium]|nr:RagB/SusD family nutrient uptake outer membrane protein [Bacteroidota bacterium]